MLCKMYRSKFILLNGLLKISLNVFQKQRWKSIGSIGQYQELFLRSTLVKKQLRHTVTKEYGSSTREGEIYFDHRTDVIEQKRKKGLNVYPHNFCPSVSVEEFISRYDILDKGKSHSDKVAIAGRVFVTRSSSKKLHFYDVVDNGRKLQVISNFKHYGGQDNFEDDNDISRGDIIGVEGVPCRTKTGELSVRATKVAVVTPSLRMLPSNRDGLKDKETKYRQRYLDLLFDGHSRETFLLRTKVITFMRKYLDDLGFTEVETPMLGSNAGGANAKPFQTHHNSLEMDFLLRISPELYLKSLVVGGLNRVYEIGKQFRNEGVDLTHNPEFTSCEFYMAFADYFDMMQLTETLLSEIVFKVFNSSSVPYTRGADPKGILNFASPFKRLSFIGAIESSLNQKLPPPTELHTPDSKSFLYSLCKQNNFNVLPSSSTSQLLDKLFSQLVEPSCIDPIFIIDHPSVMSPLAKEHRSVPGLSERFELIIGGNEICNAYSELNDPLEQRKRFEYQASHRVESKQDQYDEDYCRTLEYGLPPTAGCGIGVDRLVMILTNSTNIKDVVLFPTLKPIQ